MYFNLVSDASTTLVSILDKVHIGITILIGYHDIHVPGVSMVLPSTVQMS